MFGNKIIKTISVEGMHCAHCSKKVEDALKGIKGVKSVKVNLDNKEVEITMKEDISDDVFKNVVEDLGFEIIVQN